jgi:hypothetical protein
MISFFTEICLFITDTHLSIIYICFTTTVLIVPKIKTLQKKNKLHRATPLGNNQHH